MATTPNRPAGFELVAPYLAFTTFQSAIDNLRTHGLPDPIDRTTWDSRSGTDQVQIIGAFKFLGLIAEGDHPTEALRNLTSAAANSLIEKQILSELLRTHYGKVFDLDLKVATPGHLEEAIGSYNVSGATRDRAVRFFLKAASHCGTELSSRLTRNLRSRTSTSAPSGNTGENGAGTEGVPPQTPVRQRKRKRTAATGIAPVTGTNEIPTGNAMKTVSLPNVQGTLTISGTFNAFGLSGEERKLVYDIIDMMNAFEAKL
jgi:hypothetical protein